MTPASCLKQLLRSLPIPYLFSWVPIAIYCLSLESNLLRGLFLCSLLNSQHSTRSVICCCSVAKLCLTLSTSWTAARQAPLSSVIYQSLLEFMSIELVMLSDHLILYRPLLLPRADSLEKTLKLGKIDGIW